MPLKTSDGIIGVRIKHQTRDFTNKKHECYIYVCVCMCTWYVAMCVIYMYVMCSSVSTVCMCLYIWAICSPMYACVTYVCMYLYTPMYICACLWLTQSYIRFQNNADFPPLVLRNVVISLSAFVFEILGFKSRPGISWLMMPWFSLFPPGKFQNRISN
jgi:hypothetical protein